MRAILLAGGKGTRLRPYTTLIPKPLVPLGGEISILEIVLQQLKKAGFTHITLAVNHLSKLIMAYIGDGSRWDLKIDYSLEEKPLSTIGPLTLVKDLPERFLVMNGDVLTDLDFKKFYDDHAKAGSPITVAAFKRENLIDFGVMRYDKDHFLTGFEEKPVHSYDVSMGVYCLDRSVIEKLPKGEKYGFDDLMKDGLKSGEKVRIQPFKGFWLDIGRPEDYQYAEDHFLEIKKTLGLVP